MLVWRAYANGSSIFASIVLEFYLAILSQTGFQRTFTKYARSLHHVKVKRGFAAAQCMDNMPGVSHTLTIAMEHKAFLCDTKISRYPVR